MLTTQQQALIKAIEELELAQVQKLLAEGLDPNFIDPEQGPPVSIICDGIFKWWENVSEAYEAGTPLSCLLYTSPSPRDRTRSRMPSSA